MLKKKSTPLMQPLKNIKVLIPRPVGRSDEFSEKLIELGATPIIFPLIKVESINEELVKSTYQNKTFDWIIFTSSVAVQFFFNVIAPETVKSKIAAVGTSTKKEIEKTGLKVHFTPSAATAKKLVKEIPLNKGEKVLIPRSKIAGNAVIDVLLKRKIDVTEIATYNNTPVNYTKEEITTIFEQNINVIAFTSSSTVDSFVGLMRKHQLKIYGPHLVAIGPSTASAITKHQLKAEATAEEHNIDGLIEAIKSLY